MTKSRVSTATFAVALTTVAAAAIGLATGSASAQDTDVGREMYEVACAVCHGADGTGGGPLASILTVEPTDLTMLSAQNDGVFPLLEVIHVIDGRTGVRGHQGPMPIFGALYQSAEAETKGEYGAVLATRGRMLSLAMYLEDIQK